MTRSAFPDFAERRMKRMPPTKSKAREILHHGKVHGKALTSKQRGLFGAIAGGHCTSCTGKRYGKTKAR